MADTTTTARTTRWNLDPVHSNIEFTVKHLMISTVRGRFTRATATVHVDEDAPDQSRIEAEIDAASIDTGAPDRDDHLRSADFFDAENHPKITFRSTRIKGAHAQEGDRFEVDGDLTIRGVTQPVTLDVVYEGRGGDPWGGERVGFAATGDIDRREWGLEWNQALEAGGVMVANRLKLSLDVQLVKQAE